MIKLTRDQRLALKRLFNRAPIYRDVVDQKPLSYREFRRCVQPTFGMDGAVIARAWGMWLCIEKDGYTHT